jgi:hypothetical protein
MPDEANTTWGLVEPFDTDDGSLDGINSGECFALGVEWQRFLDRLKEGKRFTDLCLANNAARLSKMAERHRRYVEYRPATTPGWAEITVGDQLV